MFGKKTFFVITGRQLIRFLLLLLIPVIVISATTYLFAGFKDKPLSGKSIIIDPGHGGVDSGTSDGSGFLEKDINLGISLKLKAALQSEGCPASMTRENDIALDNRNNLSSSRHKRDLLARVALFNSGAYDAFVSIHVNRSSNSHAMGPIVLYSPKDSRNALLAKCIQNNLNDLCERTLGEKAVHRQLKSDFFILENSSIPGVIVETGFISNPTEKGFLRDENYQQKLVQHITKGIEEYYMKLENGETGQDEEVQEPGKEDSQPFNITTDVKLVIVE